jgi:hypothetical protein
MLRGLTGSTKGTVVVELSVGNYRVLPNLLTFWVEER